MSRMWGCVVTRYTIITTDEDQHRAYLDGPRWRAVVGELAQDLRTADKYGQGSEEYQAGVRWARDLLWRVLAEAELTIE